MTESLYDTREAWLNAAIMAHRPYFEDAGYPLPLNIRVSVGFPTTGYRSGIIGQIIYPESSSDGHYEIFINPIVQKEGHITDARIMDIVTHELLHAALDYKCGNRGHKGEFKSAMAAVGLEGPAKATFAGADWYKWAAPILTELGSMPYAEINLVAQHKTKKTYQRKVECPDCGWYAMATSKWIDNYTHLNCPVPDCGSIMICHDRKD